MPFRYKITIITSSYYDPDSSPTSNPNNHLLPLNIFILGGYSTYEEMRIIFRTYQLVTECNRNAGPEWRGRNKNINANISIFMSFSISRAAVVSENQKTYTTYLGTYITYAFSHSYPCRPYTPTCIQLFANYCNRFPILPPSIPLWSTSGH